MSDRKKGPVEALLTGIVLTLAFGVVFLLNRHQWFWIFPLVFAGILPTLEGLRRILRERKPPRIEAEEKSDREEKEILRLARDEGGTVTPALAALKTSLNTERAERVLQNLVKKGFASMNVTEEGRVLFEFPEFRKGLQDEGGREESERT